MSEESIPAIRKRPILDPHGSRINTALIFGDYYLLEAIRRYLQIVGYAM